MAPPAIDARGNDGLDRLRRRVEEPGHVEDRRWWREPAALVGLVPDDPPANPRVALRGRPGERRKRRGRARRDVRRTTAVRPTGRAQERDDRRKAGATQRLEDVVHRLPVELPPSRLDRPPVERHAHHLRAELVESRDALFECRGTELEPCVVLDADPEAGPCRGGGRKERRCEDCTADDEHTSHVNRPYPGASARYPVFRGSLRGSATYVALARSPVIMSMSDQTIQLTSQMTIVAPTYVQKPSIEKSGVTHSVNRSITTFTKK